MEIFRLRYTGTPMHNSHPINNEIPRKYSRRKKREKIIKPRNHYCLTISSVTHLKYTFFFLRMFLVIITIRTVKVCKHLAESASNKMSLLQYKIFVSPCRVLSSKHSNHLSFFLRFIFKRM